MYGPSSVHDGRNVYFTLAFAGIALMAAVFVGVAVTKWRTSRHPHAQGFVEVDQVNSTYIINTIKMKFLMDKIMLINWLSNSICR